MLSVDEHRVVADLHRLRGFGRCGAGVHRPSYSAEDMAARSWLADEMRAAGLDPIIDRVGNVHGRAPARRDVLLLGSHSDTVPRGGWLDGALGVIYALEVARCWERTHPGAAAGIEPISFADEEGTFLPLLGSRAFCGELAEADLQFARNGSGISAAEATAAAGLTGRPATRLDLARHRAFLEAHIEQGPRLEAAGIPLGLVEGIVGMRRHRLRFAGRADHAGTTPMAMRRDAGRALFAFATALDARFSALAGADTVWNFGRAALHPGAANVVPAVAELTVEFRDRSPALLDTLEAALFALAAERSADVPITHAPAGGMVPTPMAPALVNTLAAAAGEVPVLRLSSGAGHDTMTLARFVPAAMMFVPSIGGRSHDAAEDTHEDDIRLGVRVFAAACGRILHALESAPHGGLDMKASA